MGSKLKEECLKNLQKYDTPTIANAIELFNVRSKIEGFMSPDIKPILPIKKTIVGYAATIKISSINSQKNKKENIRLNYYKKVKDSLKPTIVVVEDIDSPSIGSFWGEITVSIHKALGCIGTITSGGVRDLKEVDKIGFGYFAKNILVSHGYIHIIDYNCQVKVGGLLIKPGDLLCADMHGAILIPLSIASKLSPICQKLQYSEKPVLGKCKQYFDKSSGLLSINELGEALDKMNNKINNIKSRIDDDK